jgi:hypothetical protein
LPLELPGVSHLLAHLFPPRDDDREGTPESRPERGEVTGCGRSNGKSLLRHELELAFAAESSAEDAGELPVMPVSCRRQKSGQDRRLLGELLGDPKESRELMSSISR